MRSGSMSRNSRCVITPSQSFLANKDGRFLTGGEMWDLLGLQDHDEFVYRNDIARPGSSPEQASLATGLPEAVIDSSRDRLISAGLLYREPSGGVRAIANGPAVLIERLRGELD